MFKGHNQWNGYIVVDLIVCVFLLYVQWRLHIAKNLLSIIEIVEMERQLKDIPAVMALVNIVWSVFFTVCFTSLFNFLAIRSTTLHAKANKDNENKGGT